ncbi:MAG: hypothetical protein GY805_25080 [Chloroflexi bacterium]|nr:hypothetical protein [Chloroflexota bacterium]
MSENDDYSNDFSNQLVSQGDGRTLGHMKGDTFGTSYFARSKPEKKPVH